MSNEYKSVTLYSKSCFRRIGLCMDRSSKHKKWERCLLIWNLLNIIVMQFMQIAFICLENYTRSEMSSAVTFINYYFLGIGKISSMLYNRGKLIRHEENMNLICPQMHTRMHHLQKYRVTEIFLKTFFYVVWIIYCVAPAMQTLREYWKIGSAHLATPTVQWYPIDMQNSLVGYIFFYLLQSYNGWVIGHSVLATDLNLFSNLSLLCLHFDLLSEEILSLDSAIAPLQSLKSLKNIAHKHQHVLKLVREINDIFTPSIIFCLISESFIICFVSYQILDDLTTAEKLQNFLLLCYESKQVVMTCYFGNKLIEASSKLFDALYMHNWYEGRSKEYKSVVLFMLMNTVSPVSLRVAGITSISLMTLQRVFSMSYQMFTLMQSSQLAGQQIV